MRSYKRQREPSEPIETPEEEPIKSIEDVSENLVPGLSKAEYEKIRTEALEKAKSARHAWVMKGRGKLTCTSCDFPHVSYIPTNLVLAGIDSDGKPILQKG